MPEIHPRRSMLGGLLTLGVTACSPHTISLDTAGTTSQGSTSDSTGTGEPASTDEGELPLVICEEGCTPLLRPTWAHEGPSGTRMVTEMIRDADGSLVLGLQRVDGGLGLVRLSAQGEPLWSAAPGLSCSDCELEDIALHPSGDIIISATSAGPVAAEPDPEPPPGPEPPPEEGLEPGSAVLARFDIAENRLAWVQIFTLHAGQDTQPRAGEVAVLDEDRIIHTIIDGYVDGELLGLRDHQQDGTLRTLTLVAVQPGSGYGHSPLVVPSPTGELILAHRWFDPQTEWWSAASWRTIPPKYSTLSHIPLPVALDELAVDTSGRRVELAHSRASQSVTLLLTGRRSSDPERWSTSLPLLTTSDARPTLAIGPDDDIYVAARATPRTDSADPYVVMLEVARWSSAGELRWQARRPLDMMATADPVELVVDDDGLVVGTVTQGKLHVARYEQGCACP